jgi:hypothetical protein
MIAKLWKQLENWMHLRDSEGQGLEECGFLLNLYEVKWSGSKATRFAPTLALK